MPANLGMIALGKAKQLEKRLQALELKVEEIKNQLGKTASQQIRTEDKPAVEAG